MALVGVKWLCPMFALSLPSWTLHCLWDQLLSYRPKGSGRAEVLLAAALAILRGIHTDVLQTAPMLALQHSGNTIYSTAEFMSAVKHFRHHIAMLGKLHSDGASATDLLDPPCSADFLSSHMLGPKWGTMSQVAWPQNSMWSPGQTERCLHSFLTIAEDISGEPCVTLLG